MSTVFCWAAHTETLEREVANMCNYSSYIENRGVQKGMQQGMQQGERQGEDKMGTLMSKLFSLGRMDDAQRSASDPAYRQQMYNEFNMA